MAEFSMAEYFMTDAYLIVATVMASAGTLLQAELSYSNFN